MSKSTSNPSVSVVIPTYKRARLICEAVDSVLAQTYDNFEIIVVDDGSIDDTKMVLNSRYGNRIRYIYQSNNGPSRARNRGVEEARHELIAFLDSDDLWLPDKLKLQVPLMSDPGVVLSYTNWIDSKNDSNHNWLFCIFNPPQSEFLVRQAKPGESSWPRSQPDKGSRPSEPSFAFMRVTV